MEYYNSFSMAEQVYEDEVDDHVVGFEEGRTWLPSHVLDHHAQEKPIASQLKQSAYRRSHDHNHHHKQYYHHQHRRPKISLPGHHDSIIPRHNSFSKSSSAATTLYHHHRPRFPISTSRVSSAGPGMQAIFLDSGRKTSSCGTGFFLPQRAGSTTFQPNKKSVLLPSRVVQALNLNVHDLSSQLTPRRDSNIQKLLDNNNNRNGRDDDHSSTVNSTFMCSVASQTRSSSPELFLPKEWTY